ncbi:MAG TPA: cation diffusion facilitator family transporter [Candidatus Acidoferrales bacterium]|nr:cation diffusion facilitator family transporter [Candidatus Acidoferrales bacterium]
MTDHSHSQDNGDVHPHSHAHSMVNPALFISKRGIWILKWSLLGLTATAVFQLVIVLYSGSVALLADTIHNFGDALTAIPLWIAFRMSVWKPTRRYTYGYGRVEDLAGIAVVFIILLSFSFAGYESINRLFHPEKVQFLWAVLFASLIGWAGNEVVAIFRIRVGKEIQSAALIADGYHSRVDGLTSLAVFFGALGVYLGYPLADPLVGLIITVAIFRIVWTSGKEVFIHLIDGVDPAIPNEIRDAALRTESVQEVTQVRVRWSGHRLYAEINIATNPEISVEAGHHIATSVHHNLLHRFAYLSNAVVHVDPINASGEEHHNIEGHDYGDLSPHSHH